LEWGEDHGGLVLPPRGVSWGLEGRQGGIPPPRIEGTGATCTVIIGTDGWLHGWEPPLISRFLVCLFDILMM
jgi:hypothetical protein